MICDSEGRSSALDALPFSRFLFVVPCTDDHVSKTLSVLIRSDGLTLTLGVSLSVDILASPEKLELSIELEVSHTASGFEQFEKFGLRLGLVRECGFLLLSRLLRARERGHASWLARRVTLPLVGIRGGVACTSRTAF